MRQLGDPQFVVSEGAVLWVAENSRKGIIVPGMEAIRNNYRLLKDRSTEGVQEVDSAARATLAEKLKKLAGWLAEPNRSSSFPYVVVGLVVVVVVIVLVAVLALR